jgi:UDP-glucose 4-epimerase
MDRSPIAGPALVLGGTGFLGSHVVEALLERDCPVRVFDRAQDWGALGSTPNVEICAGDFSSQGDVAAALSGCGTVFHLVGSTLPKNSNDDPVHDLESSLLSTIRFLELARQSKVKKIVFASSGGTVYGVPAVVPVPEHHETCPLCFYGVHKLAIEHYLRLYESLHGLDYCVLRLANPFGERQRPERSQGAVAVFLDRALRGEEIVVWGDGSAVRDYVYVADVARAFCLAASGSSAHRIFNIGSGHGLSVNDLISSIEALVGHPVSKRYQPGRPFDVPVNVLDISRAATHLGWRPEYSFREGLRRTMAWQQSVTTGTDPMALRP